MKKAGLETFICSFFLSLFTIFTVNGMYFREKNPSNQEIKISNKNITLFLNDMKTAVGTHAAPTKKIVLSTLPAIPQKQKESDDIPLTFGGDDVFTSEEPVLPKQYASADPPQDITPAEALSDAAGQKIVGNFDELIKHPPEIKTEKVAFASSKQKINQNKNTEPARKEKKAPAAEYVDLALNTDADIRLPDVRSLIDAKSESQAPKTALIPLEKSGIPTKGKGKVEIIDNADISGVALNANNIPIASMKKEMQKHEAATTKEENGTQWKSMAEIRPADDVRLVAKGTKHPKNNMVLDQASYKKDEKDIDLLLDAPTSKPAPNSVQVAEETAKNILIPIPEDIMKEKNLTPQLVYSDKNQHLKKEVTLEDDFSAEDETGNEKNASGDSNKSSILGSLTSIFSSSDKGDKNYEIGNQAEAKGSEDTLLSAFKRKNPRASRPSKILPTEIRLSFQPNRAEISGQTLKWIHAFAAKIIEDPATGLEIRIDGTSSPHMQQKRLNLLQNILNNQGVDFSKINTVFTAREPNSFVIRTVRLSNETRSIVTNRQTSRGREHLQW